MEVFRQRMPNGKLSPTYYVDYVHQGKRVKRSTGCRGKREAEAMARGLIDKLRKETSAKGLAETHRAILAGAQTIPLAGAWQVFTRKPRAMRAGAKQAALNASRWADFVAYILDQYPSVGDLASVTASHAEAYMAHLRTHGRYQRVAIYQRDGHQVTMPLPHTRLSAGAINAAHNTCRMVFAALTADAGLAGNPFAGLQRMAANYAKRDAFTLAEVRELINQADPFLQPVIVTAASTGLRLGDCCNLRWESVDAGAGMIVIQARKTGTAVRIPLLPGFRAYLDRHRAPGAKGLCWPRQAAMYADNPDGLSQRMKILLNSLDNAGPVSETVPGRDRKVSRRDFHSLRHSFLTLAACAGVPPHLLQQLAGHATPAMTARYTAHENDLLLQAKLAAMPDPLALGPAPQSAEATLAQVRAMVRAGGDPARVLAELAKLLE